MEDFSQSIFPIVYIYIYNSYTISDFFFFKKSLVSSTSLPFQKIPYIYRGLCSVNSVLMEFNLTFMEIT